MMYIGFPILSLIYLTIFLVVYYSKKRINLFENKIVSSLMIINAIGLVLELCCYLVLVFLKIQDTFIGTLILKIYIYYMYVFDWVLTGYICVLTDKKNISDNYNKKETFIKSLLIFMPIVLVGFIVTFFTKLNYYNIYPKYYTYGISADCLVYFTIVLAPFWIYRCIKITFIKKSRDFNIRIGTILLGILLVGIAGAMMQLVDRSMLIITSAHTVMLILMYFTIENPDMKLLEESYKAKEISDNANEEKTLFLYNMTQEIRNVTDKINDDTDIILDSKDYDEIYDSARDIKVNTSIFNNMTNDILDMSYVDASTIKVYNEKYNIKLLLKQIVNVYGDICKNKELKFVTNIDHDIPDNLYGDGISLKEVLNTILSNSVKYTEKGFIELSVNTITKGDICRLIITIEDSGIGIKSDDINKIKVDNKSLGKAYKMVTLMNGAMYITSDYGIGTKVKIILDQKIGEAIVSEVSKYDSNFDDISVLGVDDSESGLKIIEKLLKGTKIKLDLADNGRDCLDKIKIGKYDVILLDEELSQISGLDLMKKIKEIRNFKTPVILLTKDNSYEYNEEYIKNGFSDYLLKPIKKEELLVKIDKYTKKDNK